MQHVAKVLVLLASGWGVASCDVVATPEVRPVQDSAKAWLHEVDGQTLVFGNGQGQTQTLSVRRHEAVEKESQKVGQQIPYAHTYLTYRFPTQLPMGFVLVARENEVRFLQSMDASPFSMRYYTVAYVITASEEPKERSFPVKALERHYVLVGRPYPSLMRLDTLSTQPGGGPLTPYDALYYSKNHGLVAYKTPDGQLWTRR